METKKVDQAITDKMVEAAVEFCAEKLFEGDNQSALESLRKGRIEACASFSDNLVEQISRYLGEMDKMVKAVFEYEPEYATIHPRAHISSIRSRERGKNLIVWVERKSAALKALVGNLESALVGSQLQMGLGNSQLPLYSLDVKMVDDKDVVLRRGYGLIVSSQLVRSTQVWTREKNFQRVGYLKDSDYQGTSDINLGFDLELAPASKIIEQALEIEKVSIETDTSLEHYLTDLKVALIRRLISDQLAYIDVAKKWFTVSDLADIFHRRIGYGRIGGKSAGLLLAGCILQNTAGEDILENLYLPESFFLGSDLIYIFMAMNGLMHWNNQKYKPEEQIRGEYPEIQKDFVNGRFPPEVTDELLAVLDKIGSNPLIVRSSSQLEDNFGTSFAGKYDSYYCPNQGTPEENLRSLTKAISLTYASTLRPDALLYRRSKGLQDYDERMAVLIQAVQGEEFGKYFFPFGAGVAFSRNFYRWTPEIRREHGFARMVWGLGTRAVERVGDDFPRSIALSHPTLQPDDSSEAIRRYSQQYIDLIDLEDNEIKTLPVKEVLSPNYPHLKMLAQLEKDGFISSPRMRVASADIPNMVVTFQNLLRNSRFAQTLSNILQTLEEHYHGAVDIEFTIGIKGGSSVQPQVQISLLQCRPQSYLQPELVVSLPDDIKEEDILFSTQFIVPQGFITNINHVLFIVPEVYFSLPSASMRGQVGNLIAQLNSMLAEKSFICVGPGRWGSTNTDLGVFVGYSDIHNAGALVELAGKGIGPAPEPSLGTHFFQDLMEAQIYPLAIPLDEESSKFNKEFFYDTPNRLSDYVSATGPLADCLRLIEVGSFKPGNHLELVMDDEKGVAVAFLSLNS